MLNEKVKALYLCGNSVSEIADMIKMSQSGVRYILMKGGTNMRSRSEAVRIKHHKRLDSYRCTIPKKIPKDLQQLYIVGLALYWGEGSKTGNTVAIANSDPDLILTFLSFLRKICGVDERRIHVLIHYHAEHNEEKLITFWSKIMKIRKAQFYKGVLHKNKGGSTKQLQFGTISLRYSDSLLLLEILEKLDQIKFK